MHYLLLPLFLLPAFCEAAPVDVDAVLLSLVDVLPAVVSVGVAVLTVYTFRDAFKYVRQVMGADLSRSPIGAPDYDDFIDVETGKTSEQYRAEYLAESVAADSGPLVPRYVSEAEYSQSWGGWGPATAPEWSIEAGSASGAGALVSSGFDQHDKGSYTAAHWAAHQAGMSNVRDRVGEESWTTEQWLAFDAGRDDAHEAYLKATGTA